MFSFIVNLLIHSKSCEDHLSTLHKVSSRLKDAGLTARISKCFVGYKTLACFGHKLSEIRLMPEDKKVKAILKASLP